MKNLRKAIVALLVIICMMTSICTLGVFAEGTNQVAAETSVSIQQGSGGYCYVYLNDLTDIASLTVAVHYDTDKVTVTGSYNQVACTLYDSSNQNGCLQYSYIFDGEGSNEKTTLFYFYYQVNENAAIGDTYFDIVVSDAYTAALDPVNISGSRCNFSVTEAQILKNCYIYGTDSVSTSVKEEFELTYYLYESAIASGSFSIQYDSELFAVVSVSKGGLLDGKLADINTNLDGTVAVSFVGTENNYQYDLVTVKFKTLKNVTESSDIKLVVTDLYDKELNLYSCSGVSTTANIVFDESYTEDAPSMSVSSSYNSETGKVTATIKLEKDSMLGAGDFVLKFDTRYLTYISSEKGFSPTFFNINDKDVAEGILKFSIISLSDITDEQIVLTVVFDAKHYCQDKTADFEIGGSGLTDSLVNTIPLNFVDSSVIIPLKHTAATAVEENRVEPTCVANGSYNSVIYCSECKAELSREIKTIDKLGHDHSTEWTVDVEPTCTTTGSKSHHCSRCDDKTDVTTVPANGHSYGDWYVITAPTCTATGTDEHECTVCHHKETKTTNALGHAEGEVVVENRVEPTCTVNGSYDSVVYCSVCDVELSRETKTIDKLGHDHSTEWTVDLQPTCTTAGSKSHHCSRCGDKADITVIPANGHNYGDWYEIKKPTCTTTGTDEHKCSVCQHTETKTVNAIGHTEAAAVEEERVEPTCTVNGSYDSVVYCSVCTVELSRETKTLPMLGHNHSTEWTVDLKPTCTTAGSKSHHCSRCGDKADITVIPANGHNYGDWYEIKKPTCTITGTDEHKCSVCQHTETKTVNAIGHTEAAAVEEERVEPTCTVNGSYDSVVYCSVCDTELSRETKTIDMLGHEYDTDWTVDLAPTCTAVGSQSHHCLRCDDKTDVTEIPKSHHTYTRQVISDYYKASDATCTSTATYYYCCATCDAKGTTTYTNGSELGHTGGLATCTAKAECTRCHELYGDMLEHVYTAEDATDAYLKSAATCTSKAVYYKNCATCDKAGTATFEFGSTTPHSYTKQEITDTYKKSDVTCTEAAVYYYCCATCDAMGTNTFEYGTTLEHSYTRKVVTDTYKESAATCTEAAVYFYCCATCDAKGTTTYTNGSELGHTGGIATCTAKAECTRCHQPYGSMLEHVYTDQDATDAYLKSAATCTSKAVYYKNCATCDKAGTATFEYGNFKAHSYIEKVEDAYLKASATCTSKAVYYKSCSACGFKGTETFEVGDAPSHNYQTTWSSDATSHWYECSKCGDKKDNASHIAGAAATESTAQTCTVCGYVITPALGHTHNYNTTWSNNATEHWHDCIGCSSTKDNAPHDYTNACDTDCNTCGYVRTITHSYKTEWSSNEEKHWYECSVCGDKSSEANHIPGAEATETTDQVCTVCNFVIQEALGHTHNFNSSKNDETNHWKECACGEKNEITAHTWNNGEVTKEATVDEEGVKTYTCTLCSCTKNESIAKLVTNVKDTESGVTLEIPSNSQATLPAGTVIEVVEKSNESISEQILGEFAATAETVVEALGVYDLNLMLDGVKIQPNGAVVVTLPAPKLNAEYDRIIVVYIAPDGSYEECKTTVNADGSISFETDHFSKYAVIGINEEESDGGLGIGAIVAIIVGALLVAGAGGFAIYWFVIKKKAKSTEEIATDTNEASNDASDEEQK